MIQWRGIPNIETTGWEIDTDFLYPLNHAASTSHETHQRQIRVISLLPYILLVH